MGENGIFVHNGCGDEIAKEPHANSKDSKKTQHGYEIYDSVTNEPVKTGISGSVLNKDRTSKRANRQVNKLNKAEGSNRYYAVVKETNMPDRRTALEWERNNAMRLHNEGYDLPMHKRPRPWED